MESRPRLSLSEYWYPGALDRTIDATLRAACTLAWPHALYCATRFHRDIHVAHELMDEALPKAEQYILRSGRERELKPVCYRLLSLVCPFKIFHHLQTRGERPQPPKSSKTELFVDRVVDPN